MIILIHGKAVRKSHEGFTKLMAQFLKKKNPPALYRVDGDDFVESFFDGFLKTDNLFSASNLVGAKRLLQNCHSKDYIIKHLEQLASSKNIFILWEELVAPEHLEQIKKYGEVKEFINDPQDKGKGYGKDNSLFKIADLFAARKKEDAWLLYQKKLFDGIDPEDVFWKLFWQTKALISVTKGGGRYLHQFVYAKAQKSAVLFEDSELEHRLDELVGLYHRHRKGVADLAIGLEKFMLKI